MMDPALALTPESTLLSVFYASNPISLADKSKSSIGYHSLSPADYALSSLVLIDVCNVNLYHTSIQEMPYHFVCLNQVKSTWEPPMDRVTGSSTAVIIGEPSSSLMLYMCLIILLGLEHLGTGPLVFTLSVSSLNCADLPRGHFQASAVSRSPKILFYSKSEKYPVPVYKPVFRIILPGLVLKNNSFPLEESLREASGGWTHQGTLQSTMDRERKKICVEQLHCADTLPYLVLFPLQLQGRNYFNWFLRWKNKWSEKSSQIIQLFHTWEMTWGNLVAHLNNKYHFLSSHSVPRHCTKHFVSAGSHNNSITYFFIST